ncbi:hypothetical protein CLOSYM_01635 [[Clostridium] symbiosum ATCC 14940]|uniref:Uncharacterized protein n=1 Tax=[Clostridium] symbiosum ATCC 14940 TaxID=411472 RepID=A0ABC9U010_CLOSY|nr:hypothetical protein CLOSYM_01635 [[Clostridium] symbiosum ATCC 14940]
MLNVFTKAGLTKAYSLLSLISNVSKYRTSGTFCISYILS